MARGCSGRWFILAPVGLVGLAGSVVAQTGFSDVPEDHPNREAIEWSREVDAFQGYQDGTFRPDQKITAEQATIVFGRVYPDGVSRGEFAALLYAGRDLLSESPVTTTSTTTTTVAPTPETHSHSTVLALPTAAFATEDSPGMVRGYPATLTRLVSQTRPRQS